MNGKRISPVFNYPRLSLFPYDSEHSPLALARVQLESWCLINDVSNSQAGGLMRVPAAKHPVRAPAQCGLWHSTPHGPQWKELLFAAIPDSGKHFYLEQYLSAHLTLNNVLNSHLNMQLSATLNLSTCEQTLWGSVTCSYWKVDFMTPGAIWNLKSLYQRVRWLANVSPENRWPPERSDFLGDVQAYEGSMLSPVAIWNCCRKRKYSPSISLIGQDIWINSISLIQ